MSRCDISNLMKLQVTKSFLKIAMLSLEAVKENTVCKFLELKKNVSRRNS
jgi:hypothetical protein